MQFVAAGAGDIGATDAVILRRPGLPCLWGAAASSAAWAAFESLEVKIEAHMITLKFRTYLGRTGRPGYGIC